MISNIYNNIVVVVLQVQPYLVSKDKDVCVTNTRRVGGLISDPNEMSN